MFHDSFELKSLAPLSHNSIIQEFLLPEVVVLLIQEDLGIERFAIETLHRSRIFGNMMYPMQTESTALEDVLRKTQIFPVATSSTMARKMAKIMKSEPKEILLQGKLDSEVIDLTLDDD
jgi:hypothetical protein